MRRACHALDLPFTFGTFDVSTWREFTGATGERAGSGRGAVGADARGVDVVRGDRHAERRVVGPWSTVGRVCLGEPEDTHDTVSHRTEIWLGDV